MRLKSWPTSIIAVAALAVISTGLSLPFHVTGQDGQMSNCPFMGTPAICSMSAQEHIAALQSMFTAIPIQILLLTALLFMAGPILRYLTYKPPRFLYFQPEKQFVPILDHLQEAFSSGIINSKAY